MTYGSESPGYGPACYATWSFTIALQRETPSSTASLPNK